MLTRRGFFSKTIGALAAAVFAPAALKASDPWAGYYPQPIPALVDPGLSMRWVKQYDIQSDQMPMKIDVLYGFAAINPNYAARVWSADEATAYEAAA